MSDDSFARPKQTWLTAAAWDIIVNKYKASVTQASNGEPLSMVPAQNTAMLIKFFIEQASGEHPVKPIARRAIERDWGSLAAFEAQWRQLAADSRAEWIVFGLGFFDFKFHLYPLQDDAPFCVSPVLCWYLKLSAQIASDRATYVDQLWKRTDWSVGELRLQCLEQPLDIFSAPQDCVAGACEQIDALRNTPSEPR